MENFPKISKEKLHFPHDVWHCNIEEYYGKKRLIAIERRLCEIIKIDA